jgi:hypothetical protein
MKPIMKPSEITRTLISCQIEQVVSLHPEIHSVMHEFDMPLLGLPVKGARAYPGMLHTLARSPLVVVRERNQLFCTGNVRAFLMARALLPPDSKISCIEDSGDSPENIRKSFLFEFLYQPAIFGVQKANIDTIAHLARKAVEKGYIETPSNSVETHISNLYRVDRRTLIPKPMPTPEEIDQANSFWDDSSRIPKNTID